MTCLALLLMGVALAGSDRDLGEIDLPTASQADRVVGGTPSAPGDWPDAAAIYWGSSVSCTGVLVAPNLVLTAGHCEGNLTQVTLGTHDYEVGGETIPVSEYFAHPDYNGTYDVTAIVLTEPSTVTPRPLALDCVVEDYLVEGADVAIVGFGATDEWAADWGTVLNEARTTVTDPRCEDLDADCNAAVSPGGELIAGGDGIDSCSGDSGGPLYLLTPRGDFLVGLTSRGVVPSATPCGGGGIYVRADAIADWVEEMTAISLPRPECEGVNRAPTATASDIEIRTGLTGMTQVVITDPNVEDSHTLSIHEEPSQGSVTVSAAGAVVYTADFGARGPDTFILRVEDDGIPPLDGFVEIAVTGPVGPERIVLQPVGCNAAGGLGSGVWLLVALLIGCSFERSEEDDNDLLYLTPKELWTQELDDGIEVVIEDVLVTSPRSIDAFFVQQRGGGPYSGVRIALESGLNNWPPEIGTPITLYGPVYFSEEGPTLHLAKHANAAVLDDPEVPTAVDWELDPTLGFALVQANIRITSAIDPAGRADSSGPGLAALFGVLLPGYNRVGEATGILVDGRVSLREEGDWTGQFGGDPPMSATIAEVRAGQFSEGSPIAISGALQIAPWSRGGQWTVLQDAFGAGLWVDAEAWGVAGNPGDVGQWVGEVRADGDGLKLRVWTDPVVTGTASPLDGGGEDGDLVGTTLVGLTGPDDYGDWIASGWIVDDRFLDLTDLASTPVVRGVVRDQGARANPVLAVIEMGDP